MGEVYFYKGNWNKTDVERQEKLEEERAKREEASRCRPPDTTIYAPRFVISDSCPREHRT